MIPRVSEWRVKFSLIYEASNTSNFGFSRHFWCLVHSWTFNLFDCNVKFCQLPFHLISLKIEIKVKNMYLPLTANQDKVEYDVKSQNWRTSYLFFTGYWSIKHLNVRDFEVQVKHSELLTLHPAIKSTTFHTTTTVTRRKTFSLLVVFDLAA